MADGGASGMPWTERIRRRLDEPSSLDGMRAAFRTTLERQEENAHRIPDLEARRERARRVREEGVSDPRLLGLAMGRLAANRVRVLGPLSKEEARAAVLRELEGRRLVVKSKSNVTKELELAIFLQEHGVQVVETDAGDRIIQVAGLKQAHPTGPAVDLTRHDVARIMSKHLGRELSPDPDVLTQAIREDVRAHIEASEVGITGANFIAAEEGALVLIHNEGNAAECARRPSKHIAVASMDKVVPDLEEAMNLVKLQTYYGTGKVVTQYINVISGPSMTADIEKKTFYGMHGPREVVLVLVDNGRSSIEDAGMLSCINCGSCLLRCPVYDQIGKDFGGHAYLGGRGAAFTQRLDGTAAADEAGLSLCTSCGLCTEMCPVRCDTPRLVRQARRAALADGAKHPMELSALVKSVRNYHNPWMQPRQARSRWAEGLGLRDHGPVLYFAGCSPSLLFPETSRATVELLRAGGVEPSYLGKDEVCCGSTLRKLGEEGLFLEVAEEGARRIKASGAERVITACPGCYRALSEYRRLVDGFDLEAEHASQTLARLVDEGRLRFSVASTRAAWHDPCDLGRLGGVYEQPRKVLEAMPGLELREMRENRARSQCCGSGGGVRTAHPQLAERIGARRVDEAVRAGAESLVTACPWCEANLRDSRAPSGKEMEVVDLMVLARRSLAR